MNDTLLNATVPTDATASPAPWPHERHSRLVDAAGIRWHVQTMGQGPTLLLIHGTGAAVFSWRALMPLLAESFEVVAFDLPGHGRSEPLAAGAMSLEATSNAVGALLHELGLEPRTVVGHSAGMAIALSMALSKLIAPAHLIGFNAALLPYRGALAGPFSHLAKLFAALPFLPSLVAGRARDPRAVRRLLASTGSALSEEGVELYQQVFCEQRHVRATLSMMANWNLDALLDGLEQLNADVHLIVADGDTAVSPSEASVLKTRYPQVDVHCMPGLGHLAHEERPEEAARLILRAAAGQAS